MAQALTTLTANCHALIYDQARLRGGGSGKRGMGGDKVRRWGRGIIVVGNMNRSTGREWMGDVKCCRGGGLRAPSRPSRITVQVPLRVEGPESAGVL